MGGGQCRTPDSGIRVRGRKRRSLELLWLWYTSTPVPVYPYSTQQQIRNQTLARSQTANTPLSCSFSIIEQAPVMNLSCPSPPQTPPLLNGHQTTPPSSPFTDTSSSALALSLSLASAGTPNTGLTSLPSDVSKLSLGPVKKPSLEPPAVSWPYSHDKALDDIPGIAYALDLFLKSQMVESEEYCHRSDPKKCVIVVPPNYCDLRR